MNVVKTMCRPFLKRLAQKTLVRRNRCRNSPEKGRFTVVAVFTLALAIGANAVVSKYPNALKIE